MIEKLFDDCLVMDPLVKIMGAADLIAALILFTQHFDNIILLIVAFILLIKGAMSMFS
jgi:hypothetical protein